MPAIPIVSAVGGLALQAKGQSDARKAANQAINAPAPTVDINALDAQARQIAQRNAADSAALEAQYNPGAAELRRASLGAVIDALAAGSPASALQERILAQAGTPLTAQQFDSPLTRDAIEAARSDLALGGNIPLDVQQQIARRALARSGTVTGNLGLGRDLTTRDLGLTSLQLRDQRLARASQIGAQEAGLEQANAAMRAAADRYGRDNLFDSASVLNQIASGDFARAFGAAQLGQNIAQPAAGLDPGSIANLAVGNTNAIAQKQQQDAAIRANQAAGMTQFGSQLLGAGLGMFNTPRYTATPVGTPATGGNYYPSWFQPVSTVPVNPYTPGA